MALTVTEVDVWHEGDREIRLVDVAFDSTYPAGGEPLTYTQLGFGQRVDYVGGALFRKTDGSDAVAVSYDYTNSKLWAYNSGANAGDPLPQEATADISAYSGRLLCWGQ